MTFLTTRSPLFALLALVAAVAFTPAAASTTAGTSPASSATAASTSRATTPSRAAATRTTRRSSPRPSRSVRRSRFASSRRRTAASTSTSTSRRADRGMTVAPISEVYVSRGAKGLAAVKTRLRDARLARRLRCARRLRRPPRREARRARRLLRRRPRRHARHVDSISLSARRPADLPSLRAAEQGRPRGQPADRVDVEQSAVASVESTTTARPPSSRSPPAARRSSRPAARSRRTSRSRCRSERARRSRAGRLLAASAVSLPLAGCGAEYDHTDITLGHAPPKPARRSRELCTHPGLGRRRRHRAHRLVRR